MTNVHVHVDKTGSTSQTKRTGLYDRILKGCMYIGCAVELAEDQKHDKRPDQRSMVFSLLLKRRVARRNNLRRPSTISAPLRE